MALELEINVDVSEVIWKLDTVKLKLEEIKKLVDDLREKGVEIDLINWMIK